MSDDSSDRQWYSVRCVLQAQSDRGFRYEERVTLWQAVGIDDAIGLAEAEVVAYAQGHQVEYTGLAQAYGLVGAPSSGTVAFSLVRGSELGSDDYLDRFFDTGQEVQGGWADE